MITKKLIDQVQDLKENKNLSITQIAKITGKGLAGECGNFTPSTTREALTILEGEMRGYYKNARRGNYGPNVKGLDYVVEGLGEFAHITHVETKGAVSSSIQPKPTLIKQAKKFLVK